MARPPHPLGCERGAERGSGRPRPHAPDRNWRVPGNGGGKPFAITGFLGYVPPPDTRTAKERNSPLLLVAACGLTLAGWEWGPAARGGEPPEAPI